MTRSTLNRYVRTLYFEGEPTPPVTPPVTPPTAPPAGMLTQEKVNALLAEEKRKFKQQQEQTLQQLETLKQNQSLTQQERDGLEARIQQITESFQTEAETKALELKKIQTAATAAQTKLTEERDSWKTRFDRKLVEVDVASAAIESKAFSSEQLSAILAPITKVVEDLDENQKPNGNFISKVDFVGEDKDGKPVKLSLSVTEAVKAMSKMEKYSNLFRAEGQGGMGGNTNGGSSSGKLPSLDNMTPAQYVANRTRIRQEMANSRG